MTLTPKTPAAWFVLAALITALACGESSAAPASPPASEAAPAPAPSAAQPAPAQAPAAEPTQAAVGPAELGQPAPPVVLTDIDGQSHDLGKLKGKTVVLEWFNPECPFVRASHGDGTLKEMAKRTQSDSIVWLSVNSSAPGKQGTGVERNRAAKAQFAMENPILLDETGQVGRAYGAIKTPHLFVIDPEGTLVYRGGIDNAPMNVVDDARPRFTDSKPGERVNYVDGALQDLKKGTPLRLPDTPPYGCTVKYAS